MPGISSSEIKRVKSLGLKKFRDSLGMFTVEGEKLVAEALKSPFKVEKVYRKEDVGEDAMSRMSQLSSPSPVLAVVRKPDLYAASAMQIENLAGKPGLYIGLDSIRDPGNLGTIIRIADWFGIGAVFASPDTVDLFNPKVVQATMGAVFRVKFLYADLVSVAGAVLKASGKVYGTFLDGKDIYGATLDPGTDSPVMVITGNESEGISERVSEIVSDRLFIPPYPRGAETSESLNAAVATAVTIAEFRRLAEKP